MKISGLRQAGQAWTADANAPIVRGAISAFGIDRCMFASNFPVDSLVAGFDRIFRGFMTITADMPEKARQRLFNGNATRFYRLDR